MSESHPPELAGPSGPPSHSDQPKPSSRRKGTRSVSNMTPEQLNRKRANDREAQRAIRARTRETIARLKQEVKELRGRQDRDEMVRELRQRNKALEDEVRTLRETLSLRGRPYQVPGFYAEGLPATTTSPISGPPPPYAASQAEYGAPHTFAHSYLPTPEPSFESWPGVVPVSSAVTAPSGVSSPCSSAGPPEDFIPSYVPVSLQPSMVQSYQSLL